MMKRKLINQIQSLVNERDKFKTRMSIEVNRKYHCLVSTKNICLTDVYNYYTMTINYVHMTINYGQINKLHLCIGSN